MLVAPVRAERQQRVVARRPGRRATTPNGSPSARTLAGTAIAQRSSRLTKFVYVPSSVLRAIGASAICAAVKTVGAVGSSSASARSQTAAVCAAQLAQAVGGLERLDRADVAPGHDDLAHDRIDGVRVGGDERADGGVALGDPRSAVEQRRRLGERGEVDLDELPAERRRARQRVLPCRGGMLVAGELELVAAGDRDPRAGRAPAAAAARGAPRAREYGSPGSGPPATASTRSAPATSVVRIDTQSRLRQAGTTPLRADPADRGLEADDAVEGGRHAARAGGVGAERERHGAVGDDDRRARARPAGDVARIGDARAGAVGRARAGQAGGELVHVRLADRDRARRR